MWIFGGNSGAGDGLRKISCVPLLFPRILPPSKVPIIPEITLIEEGTKGGSREGVVGNP